MSGFDDKIRAGRNAQNTFATADSFYFLLTERARRFFCGHADICEANNVGKFRAQIGGALVQFDLEAIERIVLRVLKSLDLAMRHKHVRHAPLARQLLHLAQHSTMMAES